MLGRWRGWAIPLLAFQIIYFGHGPPMKRNARAAIASLVRRAERRYLPADGALKE